MSLHKRLVVLAPHDGRSLTAFGNRITYKVTGDETGGQFAMVEFEVPPGPGVGTPLHHHPFDELFYILAGTITFVLGDETVSAQPGSFVYVPGGTVHRYTNEEAVPARYLGMVAPAGFEKFAIELADLVASAPAHAPSADDLLALNRRYGIVTVEPGPE